MTQHHNLNYKMSLEMLFKEQKFFRKKSIFPSFHLFPFGVIHISWTLLWAIYKAILNRTTMRDLVLRGATVIAVVHEIQVCYETKWNLHCRFIAILPLYKWNRSPLKGTYFSIMGEADPSSGEDWIASSFTTTIKVI